MLCARKREQVTKLVVGYIGAICPDCVAMCAEILKGEPADPGASYRSSLGRKIEVVPTNAEPQTKLTVEIDPDVAEVFPDSASINAALKPLAVLITSHVISKTSKDPS